MFWKFVCWSCTGCRQAVSSIQLSSYTSLAHLQSRLAQWRQKENESARKKFLCPSSFFGSKSTISRFGERFRDGQYSFVSLLIAVFRIAVPPHL